MDIISSIQTYLSTNIPKMIVKYNKYAKENETTESRQTADVYMSAKMGTDSWVTYPTFDATYYGGLDKFEIINIVAAEIPMTDDVKENIIFRKNRVLDYYKDADILKIIKTKLVDAAHQWILENYNELNQYYRTLNGKPKLGDPGIWLTDDEILTYELPLECINHPVHDLSDATRIYLESRGVLTQYINDNPNNEYLKYVGERQIPIDVARSADNFDILYIPKTVDNYSLYRDFIRAYNQSKEYMMSVVYNMYYSTKYDYYDNYLAFIILTMSVQRLVNNVFNIVINRDFYDVNMVRTFLDAYGIPYCGSLSMYQNRLIVKNLNILLSKKSSSRVFIDIMDLLGFNDTEVLKYYITRQHKRDLNGDLIFSDNPEDMFDVFFTGIPINSDDVYTDLKESTNILSYEEMVSSDPLWSESSDESGKTTKQKIMESEFNYLQSKYIDVNVVLKMQEILFDTIYSSRMILDDTIDGEYPMKRVFVHMAGLIDDEISLFDVIVLLICLLCKVYDIAPDILEDPSKILYVMGFNFDNDFDKIRKDLLKNRIMTEDGKYVSTITDFSGANQYFLSKLIAKPSTVKDVNDMFAELKVFRELLADGMAHATDLDTYYAYKKLYDTCMYCKLTDKMYKLPDNTFAKTYSEYLKETNLALFNLYDVATPDQCMSYMEYITQRLPAILENMKNLSQYYLLQSDDLTVLIRLLKFFASYTVDIRKVNVVLLLDDNISNLIKVLDKIGGMSNTLKAIEKSGISPVDIVSKIIDTIHVQGVRSTYDVFQKELVFLKHKLELVITESREVYSTDRLVDEVIVDGKSMVNSMILSIDEVSQYDVIQRMVESMLHAGHVNIIETPTYNEAIRMYNMLRSVFDWPLLNTVLYPNDDVHIKDTMQIIYLE